MSPQVWSIRCISKLGPERIVSHVQLIRAQLYRPIYSRLGGKSLSHVTCSRVPGSWRASEVLLPERAVAQAAVAQVQLRHLHCYRLVQSHSHEDFLLFLLRLGLSQPIKC